MLCVQGAQRFSCDGCAIALHSQPLHLCSHLQPSRMTARRSRVAASSGLWVVLQLWLYAVGSVHCAATLDTTEAWPSWGGNLNNTRSASASALVNQQSVGNLSVAWVEPVLGAVSASPFVHNNSVVFPTWAGQLYALNSLTGEVQWQKPVGEYVLSSLCERPSDGNVTDEVLLTSVSRTTPALAGPDLIVIATSLPTIAVGGLPYVLGTTVDACPQHLQYDSSNCSISH